MENSSARVPAATALNRRWVLAVRVANAVAAVLLGLFMVATFSLVGPLFLVPAVPFVYFQARLFSSPSPNRQKNWLALVFGTGSCVFVAMVLCTFALTLGEFGMVALAFFLPVALLEAVPVVGAIQMYRAMGREPGDQQKLVRGLLSGVVYCFVILIPFAVAIPGLLRSRVAANEASATSALRTLNTSEDTYAQTYHRGFTDGLNALGPSVGGKTDASHADLVDKIMAGLGQGGTNTRFTRGGYIFAYTSGPPGADGRIASYTISARPVKMGETGQRNFFTDQSGVIRSTHEDRPATAQDQPI